MHSYGKMLDNSFERVKKHKNGWEIRLPVQCIKSDHATVFMVQISHARQKKKSATFYQLKIHTK